MLNQELRFEIKTHIPCLVVRCTHANFQLEGGPNSWLRIGLAAQDVAVKLRGHYNYYGLQDNRARLQHYYFEVVKNLHKWLNRRSQRKTLSWDKLKRMLEHNPLPRPPEYRKLKRLDGRINYAW